MCNRAQNKPYTGCSSSLSHLPDVLLLAKKQELNYLNHKKLKTSSILNPCSIVSSCLVLLLLCTVNGLVYLLLTGYHGIFSFPYLKLFLLETFSLFISNGWAAVFLFLLYQSSWEDSLKTGKNCLYFIFIQLFKPFVLKNFWLFDLNITKWYYKQEKLNE